MQVYVIKCMEFKLCLPQISTVEWCNDISSTLSAGGNPACLPGLSLRVHRGAGQDIQLFRVVEVAMHLYSPVLQLLNFHRTATHRLHHNFIKMCNVINTRDYGTWIWKEAHSIGSGIGSEVVRLWSSRISSNFHFLRFNYKIKCKAFHKKLIDVSVMFFYQINTKLMPVPAMFQDKRLWQVSTREATSGRSLLLFRFLQQWNLTVGHTWLGYL